MNCERLYRAALAAHQKGDWTRMNRFIEAAAAALENRREVGLLHGLVWNALAQILDHADRCTEAETFYLRALALFELELEPDHPLRLSSLDVLKTFYESLGKQEQAAALEKRLEAVLSASPWGGTLSRTIRNKWAEPNARQRGRHERVDFLPSQAYLEARRRSSRPASLKGLLAQYYHGRGWLDQAIYMYQEALKEERFDPSTSARARKLSSLEYLAEALREMDRGGEAAIVDEAAAPLREAFEQHQSDLRSDDPAVRAAALHREGVAQEEEGDFVRAAESYRQGLLCETEDRRTWYFLHNNLGFCHIQLEHFEEAESLCRRAIAIDPRLSNAHKNLGLALYGQGRWQEAARHYVDSVKVSDGGDPRGMFLLEALLNEHPELEEALPDIRAELSSCQDLSRKVTDAFFARMKKKPPN